MPTQNPINVALIAAMSPTSTYQVSLSDSVVLENNATSIESDLVNPTPYQSAPFVLESTSPTGSPTTYCTSEVTPTDTPTATYSGCHP